MKASDVIRLIQLAVDEHGSDLDVKTGQLEDPNWLTDIKIIRVMQDTDGTDVIGLKPY